MKIKNRNFFYTGCEYIEITENGVYLHHEDGYKKEYYNKFANIKRFEVIINVEKNSYSGRSYSKISSILIKLVTKDMNNLHTIECNGSWEIIYQLLDYKKYFPKFLVKVNGSPYGIDIPIKIYSKFGKKLWLKNSDSYVELYLMAMMFLIYPCWMIIETYTENQLATFSDYTIVVCLIIVSMIALSPIIYQEYQTYQIRKMLGL